MLRKLITLLVTVFLLSTNWVSVRAQTQTPDIKFFSETGHHVKGEFLLYYNSNLNATIIYGYPITEEFTNKDGNKIQYFQLARFEPQPDLTTVLRVQHTLL